MADDGLARRVRDYARDRADVLVAVSSVWLAREFAVDPRTVAAALRPYGIRPTVVEPGVRGYVVGELAAIRFDEEVIASTTFRADDPADDGWGEDLYDDDLLPDFPDSTALERLSAGAGHDMTPALRAAGLL